MSIHKALFSYIFLIFQIFMFAVCYDKILNYDLYYGEEPDVIPFRSSLDRRTVAFSTRIMIDLLLRTYLDKGVIFTSSNASTITITGECDIERPCWALEWLAADQLEFECSNVCRYLTFEGNLYNFRVEINGYHLLTETLIGCYMNNETMTVSGEGFDFRCPPGYMSYFGLHETDSGLKTICIKSLFHLKRAKLRECNIFCNSAPRRLCGGSGNLVSVYSFRLTWGINLIVDCFYHSVNCPDCPEGREGLNCERVVCTKDNGRCGNGICESVDYFDIGVCTCDIGFDPIFGKNRFSCLDINECWRVTCDSNAIGCLNNPGSYVCECKDGFINADPLTCEDIDECASSLCGSHAECENSPGSFHCECYAGYQLESPTKCIDIDECAVGTYGCDDDTTDCQNIPSYYTCSCKPGFHNLSPLGTRQYCSDRDECLDDRSDCNRNTTTCQNTHGSYHCGCIEGYIRLNRTQCEDFDECGNNPCDLTRAYCKNTLGSFFCKCRAGFLQLSPNVCRDIDECGSTHPCEVVSTYCENIPGSFECKCRAGFRREDTLKCKDVDECSLLLHHCGKALCTNTIGSFSCNCPLGTETIEYKYAVECKDIDECNEANKCNKSVSICLNVMMGYVCQCFSGYMNTDNFTCTRDSRTRLTTIYDLYEDDWYTTTEYSVATSEDYESDLTTEYVFLLPVLLFSIAVLIWCFIWTNKYESHSPSISTITSFDRMSNISRQSQI